jgi:hypothetical protein
VNDLNAVFSQVGQIYPAPFEAQRIATAIDTFCRKGIVTTTGTFTAPAIVDPLTFSGDYLTGTGQSRGYFS